MAEGKGHETRDVDVRAVGRVAVWFTICLGLIGVALLAMFWRDVERQTIRKGPIVPLEAPESRFPAPGARPETPQDLARLRRSEEQLLDGYAWVDRKAGIVRIPIERAMALVASQGLSVRPADGR